MEAFPLDWQRALVLMAHPDDAEYGTSAAVAEWVAQGKEVRYVLATRGEAGIAGLPPQESGPLREQEQRSACDRVGVEVLEFLDYPDGRIVESLQLRRDLAEVIRRHRPDGVVTLNHSDSWGSGTWNSEDHRALGRSVLNAVADAANEWIFPDLAGPPHRVDWTAILTLKPTHLMPVSEESVQKAIQSLAAHKRYLRALNSRPVEEQATEQVRWATALHGSTGVGFEVFGL
ncbi:PIG-L family deacetylase [Arthrobacter sp. JZ12]|uniref:PIG-L deacetylase family protein n=1 Tax=Arthrobacter sp. JZ12 TaxID=2654190 RepID=UPI002B47CF27|nr:PIG-L family deacetylase [Arthrobacter sp. JZ12]WRH24302.1 PIG-L family deacetylase [Arthrobacter sp. JZ12]